MSSQQGINLANQALIVRGPSDPPMLRDQEDEPVLIGFLAPEDFDVDPMVFALTDESVFSAPHRATSESCILEDPG